LRQRAERFQLAIGIEDVVLGLVGREGIGRVGRVLGVAGRAGYAPMLYLASAFFSSSLSEVKSWSTCMRVESETTLTMSAGDICSSTNLSAATAARSISSGSMPVRSKKSTIRRRSRSASLGGGGASTPLRLAVSTVACDGPAPAALAIPVGMSS
jgi:hypothetical protein